MEKNIDDVEVNFCFVGLIKKEDGWYKMYSDFNKNYKFVKETAQCS